MLIGRIVDVAESNRHLAVERGFLVVSSDRVEVGRVPLDDVAAVVAHGYGTTFTSNLVTALAEREAAFVVCGANHQPAAVLWPTEAHHRQAERMDLQMRASRPLNKRLWQQLVRAKIAQQAAVLEAAGEAPTVLTGLLARVRSGDPDNVEAQAARRYWTRLFGEDFRRDQDAEGTNALLNYGYTVMRAATARAVYASGLLPSLGLAHRQGGNAMRLVDDLMEPYRPIIDACVAGLVRGGLLEVVPVTKRALAGVLYRDVNIAEGTTTLMGSLFYMAQSLVKVYAGERDRLSLPSTLPAPELRALFDSLL